MTDPHPLKVVDLAAVERALGDALTKLVGVRFEAQISAVSFVPPPEGRLSQRFRLELSFSRPVEDWLPRETEPSERE